ncbi:Lipopolysaccharide biosynthesis protein, LPS:glycosyltransferase [Granulicella rosea]|uniref:Lipopolysaccharide biosynthesis protein, LPS:glycosyltransferase n=2 Tax=Granulicella rosea TaxID=474952 RepID=A0A239L6H9_9BACT|nr:Lipopolysaccharide biosynthesis protein, LPS:glycosyltransferase [Granulicella rosea]
MEAPLHVAASSVLRHVAEGCTVRFHLLLTGFSQAQRDHVLRTFDHIGKPYEVRFLPEPPAAMFAGLRPFHGNMTTYYRLALPDLVDASRLLYIDADTATSIDVSALLALPPDGNPAGFVEGGVVSDYPEKAFYARVGLAPDTPAFNAGVMLFNLDTWRAEGWTNRILAFCRTYPNDLSAADQTAMTATFAGKFQRLPPEFNIALYPSNPVPQIEQTPGIYHFVGSPKPWDLGGRVIHTAAGFYFQSLESTTIQHRAGYLKRSQWYRAWSVRGGYARALKGRLLS